MKSKIRVPLRSLNRKKEKEKEQQLHKIKSCPTSQSCDSSITRTSSYYSCTSTLGSGSTQTRKSAEPPGWVHNAPSRSTLDEDNVANSLSENSAPTPLRCYQPPPLKSLYHHDGVPSPVRVRSPLPPQHHMLLNYRQNMAHMMMNDGVIHMNFSSESSCSESGGCVVGDATTTEQLDFERFECAEEMIQQMNRKMKSKNWKINFELCDGGDGQILRNVVGIEHQVSFLQAHLREKCASIAENTSEQIPKYQVNESFFPDDLRSPPAAESDSAHSPPFTSPPGTPSVNADIADNNMISGSPQDEGSTDEAPTASLDIGRVTNIYASMMLEFRKKIIAELREEMQQQTQHQFSAIKSELSEINNKLLDLEKNHKTAPNLHQELERASSDIETNILNKVTSEVKNIEAKQQRQLEAMLDVKLAHAMAKASVELNLAVYEVKKEGERLSKLALRGKSRQPGEKNHENTIYEDEEEDEEEEMTCESELLNRSFAEALQTIDEFVEDCDNLANEFETIASRIGGESDDEYSC